MKYEVIEEHLVALLLHNEGDLMPDDAKSLVRCALEEEGFEPWGQIEIDMFSSGEDTLLIAKPALVYTASIADYALPFIKGFPSDF